MTHAGYPGKKCAALFKDFSFKRLLSLGIYPAFYLAALITGTALFVAEMKLGNCNALAAFILVGILAVHFLFLFQHHTTKGIRAYEFSTENRDPSRLTFRINRSGMFLGLNPQQDRVFPATLYIDGPTDNLTLIYFFDGDQDPFCSTDEMTLRLLDTSNIDEELIVVCEIRHDWDSRKTVNANLGIRSVDENLYALDIDRLTSDPWDTLELDWRQSPCFLPVTLYHEGIYAR